MVADLQWDLNLSETEIWQREQVVLEVTVQAPDPFAMLKADKLVIPGMEVVRLANIDQDENTDIGEKNNGKRQLSLRWQLYPHTPGKHQIQLPPIRYYIGGGTRSKWQPPAQTIDVRALPPYMPPTIPVGSVNIESFIEPKGILKPETLAYWHVKLSSKAVTSGQFPPILKQVKTTDSLDVLPAKVTTQSNTETGVFQMDYRIPFKAKSSGRLDLPELQWHWFDPNTARLEKVRYSPPQPIVLSLWQKIVLIAGSGLVALLALYQLIIKGLKHYRRWWAKYKVLQQLNNKQDDKSMREAMTQCAEIHGWSDNLSIRQWLQSWEQIYGENQRLRSVLLYQEQQRFSVFL